MKMKRCTTPKSQSRSRSVDKCTRERMMEMTMEARRAPREWAPHYTLELAGHSAGTSHKPSRNPAKCGGAPPGTKDPTVAGSLRPSGGGSSCSSCRGATGRGQLQRSAQTRRRSKRLGEESRRRLFPHHSHLRPGTSRSCFLAITRAG